MLYIILLVSNHGSGKNIGNKKQVYNDNKKIQ